MSKELAQDLEPAVPQEEIDAAEKQEAPQGEETQSSKEKEVEQNDPQAKETKEEEVRRNLNAALKEERTRRKNLEEQFRRDQAERAQKDQLLQDRLNQLWQAQSPGPQLRDPETDPDPVGALKHNQALTLQAMQQMHARQQTEDARQRMESQKQNLIGWARSNAAQFAQEVPDFPQAYEHVRRNRIGELQAMGLSEEQVAMTLHNDEIWVFQNAAQTGKNPAEIIYNMAKNTGFAMKPEQPPQVAAEKKLETLQNGVKASQNLSGGSSDKPTPQQIAEMSEEEFETLKAKLKKQGKRLSDAI